MPISGTPSLFFRTRTGVPLSVSLSVSQTGLSGRGPLAHDCGWTAAPASMPYPLGNLTEVHFSKDRGGLLRALSAHTLNGPISPDIAILSLRYPISRDTFFKGG